MVRLLSLVRMMSVIGMLSLMGAVATTMAAPFIDETCREDVWITDSAVHVIMPYKDKIYIGGTFNMIGPYTGCAVPFDTSGSRIGNAFSRVDGKVYAICADSANGFYIAGKFDLVGGNIRSNIIHVNAKGELDPVFNPEFIDAEVFTLCLSGSTLFAGGKFSKVGTTARHGLAAFSATNGALLDWNSNLKRSVRSLAVYGEHLYVGGERDSINDTVNLYFGAFSIADGTLLPWSPKVNGSVQAIAANQNTVYIGGNFTTVGEASIGGLAAIDAVTGQVSLWNPVPFNGVVKALELNGKTLYAAGSFSALLSINRYGLAAFDTESGNLTAWNPNAVCSSPGAGSCGFHSIDVCGDRVYVSGMFSKINGIARNYAGAIDLSTGALLAWQPEITNGVIYAVAGNDSSIMVGGDFYSAGWVKRVNIAAIDTGTGAPTPWQPDAKRVSGSGQGQVLAMSIYDTVLYVGGKFDTIAGVSCRQSLAAFDLPTGKKRDWNVTLNVQEISAITTSIERVFIGGIFDSTPDHNRFLAAVDMTTGAFATTWKNATAPEWGVNRCLISGTRVYIGGRFSTTPLPYLASVEIANGTVTSWNPDANYIVFDMLLKGNTLYAAGAFDSLGGKRRSMIGAVDIITGEATSWNTPLDLDKDDSNRAEAIALDGNVFFAGGYFNNDSSKHKNLIALDAASGAYLDWDPQADGVVHALAVHGSTLYVGGHIKGMGNGLRHRNFAAFRMDAASGNIKRKGAPAAHLPKAATFSCTGTSACFSLAANTTVTLDIYTVGGQKIAALVSGYHTAGTYAVPLPTTRMAPGMYLLVLQTGEQRQLGKTLMVR